MILFLVIGTMVYGDGVTSYKGEWKTGKRHGHGVFVTKIGTENVVVDTMWNRGKMVNDEIT